VNACCWSPDGRYLCTAASDKTCLVWDMTSILPEAAANAAASAATPPAPATAAAANADDDDDVDGKGDSGDRKSEAGEAGQPPLAPLCAITGHEDYVQVPTHTHTRARALLLVPSPLLFPPHLFDLIPCSLIPCLSFPLSSWPLAPAHPSSPHLVSCSLAPRPWPPLVPAYTTPLAPRRRWRGPPAARRSPRAATAPSCVCGTPLPSSHVPR